MEIERFIRPANSMTGFHKGSSEKLSERLSKVFLINQTTYALNRSKKGEKHYF